LVTTNERQVDAVDLHVRHTVAKWLSGLSLTGRLSFVVALIAALVIGAAAYLEVHSLERTLEGELVDAARLAARSVAGDLTDRSQPLEAGDVRDALHDLLASDSVLDTISVFELVPGGGARLFASTSTEERGEVAALAEQAMTRLELAEDRGDTQITFVTPVPRLRTYAVAVTVGLDSLQQVRVKGTRIMFGFAVPAILLVTVLMRLTFERVLNRPLASILRTMQTTARGDFSARAILRRRDELGTIADGLNHMLDELEQFNRSLQERVDEATRDLSLRNAQLAASQTELLGLRESLARTERMAAVGRIAAAVAHQAGTPLNLVSGYVQMIRDDPRTDEAIRKRLRTVDAQIQQVVQVLRTMLDHARLQPAPATVSLAEMIERVRELAEPRLSRAGIKLQISVPDGLPPLLADSTQFEMALLNLVTNALDAMSAGGTLTITAAAIATGIRLTIADTGPGIAPEIMDRIFEPWVTSKPAGQGTGLGLAIVRHVVQAHGGTISVRNESTGAVFAIELPAAAVSTT
jgi:signal transduction histidine kinase